MRETIRVTTLSQALEAKREHPDSLPIAGGTDLMVELNFRKRRPEQLLDLNPVAHFIQLCTLVYPQKFGRPDTDARGDEP